jgi:hypothetical protein
MKRDVANTTRTLGLIAFVSLVKLRENPNALDQYIYIYIYIYIMKIHYFAQILRNTEYIA